MSYDYALSGRYVGTHRREVKSCFSCSSEFTWANRQHHCRACGEAMCSACLGPNKLPMRYCADLFKEEREKAWPHEAGRPKECQPDAPRTVWSAEPQAACPACTALVMEESRRSLESALEDQEARFEHEKELLTADLNDAMALLKKNGIEFHTRLSFQTGPRDLSFSDKPMNSRLSSSEPRVSGHGG